MTIIKNKKQRIDDGLGIVDEANKNTELDMGLNGEDIVNIEQETQNCPNINHDLKNVKMTGLVIGVHQTL